VKDTPRQGTPWLDVLKNMDVGAISEAKNGLDVDSSSEDTFSESLSQQGDKSAKRRKERLLALLSPRHIRDFRSYLPREGCRAKTNPTKGRPGWRP
jgi:hypothetical protein